MSKVPNIEGMQHFTTASAPNDSSNTEETFGPLVPLNQEVSSSQAVLKDPSPGVFASLLHGERAFWPPFSKREYVLLSISLALMLSAIVLLVLSVSDFTTSSNSTASSNSTTSIPSATSSNSTTSIPSATSSNARMHNPIINFSIAPLLLLLASAMFGMVGMLDDRWYVCVADTGARDLERAVGAATYHSGTAESTEPEGAEGTEE